MDELLGRIVKLEEALKRLQNFVSKHHQGPAITCEPCREIKGLPKLIDKKQYARLFDASNMLKQVDPRRSSKFFAEIASLCQVKNYKDVTTDQWGEVEKILMPIEQEMKQLRIEPINEWKKR